MRLQLRYPATADHALDHAQLAVEAVFERSGASLDYSPGSLEDLDACLEGLREEGLTGEEEGELLFVLGCYLGEVMVRALRGAWRETSATRLAGLSPWPLVVVLGDGSAWDPIGKTFKRLELGDAEYLPAFLLAAGGGLGPGR